MVFKFVFRCYLMLIVISVFTVFTCDVYSKSPLRVQITKIKVVNLLPQKKDPLLNFIHSIDEQRICLGKSR